MQRWVARSASHAVGLRRDIHVRVRTPGRADGSGAVVRIQVAAMARAEPAQGRPEARRMTVARAMRTQLRARAPVRRVNPKGGQEDAVDRATPAGRRVRAVRLARVAMIKTRPVQATMKLAQEIALGQLARWVIWGHHANPRDALPALVITRR